MIEATVQIGSELVDYEFHVLPRIGDIIRLATSSPVVTKTFKVTNIIHLIVPGENSNSHLINIVTERML